MVENEIVKQIEDFVYAKPRSIQEIAVHIEKNWRTADRYIEEIAKDYGTISSRVFREGTRGALKIVYWSSMDKVSYSVFQEELEKEIFAGRTKYEFCPFDIFQHVDNDKKSAWIKKGENESKAGRLREFKDILMKAERQILFFSGNLSFINFDDGEVNVFSVLDELVKRGVSTKVVCRVDVAGVENVGKLLSLNHKYGKELVQVRHREQPLRVSVIDDKIVNMKEIKEPTCRSDELNERTFIFYNITDRDWINWITRIFWKMFNTSIDAKKRREELRGLRA